MNQLVMTRQKKLTLTAVFVAACVILSPFAIPLGSVRLYPMQALCNVVLAVFLGTRYNVSAAFCTSCLRNALALGSPLAFPGSMVGAFLAGLVYRYTKVIWLTALAEIIGTGLIGAAFAYPLMVLVFGKALALMTLVLSFTASSAAGAVLGTLLLYMLKARKYK